MSRYRRTSQSDNSTPGFGGSGSGDRGGDGGLNGEHVGGMGGSDLPEWCTDDTGFEGGFDATGQFMAQDDGGFGGRFTRSVSLLVDSIVLAIVCHCYFDAFSYLHESVCWYICLTPVEFLRNGLSRLILNKETEGIRCYHEDDLDTNTREERICCLNSVRFVFY